MGEQELGDDASLRPRAAWKVAFVLYPGSGETTEQRADGDDTGTEEERASWARTGLASWASSEFSTEAL
jgi:hypothetical protein